jgi:hypothetical protein
VEQWRVPWGFRVYRGKDTRSPVELGLQLVKGLPKTLTKHFEVLVLADTAFGSNEFVTKVRQLKHHALVGIRCDRKLEDERSVAQLHKREIQVRLYGLKSGVHLFWYYCIFSQLRHPILTKFGTPSYQVWQGENHTSTLNSCFPWPSCTIVILKGADLAENGVPILV